MDSSKVPDPLPQKPGVQFCDICNIECNLQKNLTSRCADPKHTTRSKQLAKCVFGYHLDKRITCLDDLFSHPRKKGAFIGMEYLRSGFPRAEGPSYACTLCGVSCTTLFQHILSIKHRRKYIGKHFQFLLQNYESLSPKIIEQVAVAIEKVESVQKLQFALKNEGKNTIAISLDSGSKQNIEKIAAQLHMHKIDLKKPYDKPYAKGNVLPDLTTGAHVPCAKGNVLPGLTAGAQVPCAKGKVLPGLTTGAHVPCAKGNVLPGLTTGAHVPATNENKNINPSVPSGPSVAAENVSRQVNIEKPQIRGIDFNNANRKQSVPGLQTGTHTSGTNEKKNIISNSVPSQPAAASKITPWQVNAKIDKPQIHGIQFKDACRKEKDVVSLQARSSDFAINEKSVKRPSRFTPLAYSKRPKSEWPGQYTAKPISSLSRPVPVPFSVSDSSGGVSMGKYFQQSSKVPTTSYIPPVNVGMMPKPIPSLLSAPKPIPSLLSAPKPIPSLLSAPKPIPSLLSSQTGGWLYQAPRTPAGPYVPSWPQAASFYQTALQGYGYSNQNPYGFPNISAYPQASSVSDVGKANAFEGQLSGQETGHRVVQHIQTLGTIGGAVSSHTEPISSVSSIKQDTFSRYGYNSVDNLKSFSKSSTPSGVNSFLKQEPSLSKSFGDSRPPERSLPTTSTSSRVQKSQSTNSNMPADAASMLSAHTLKILQGREPESVKSILKRLSEYCPELQQIDISLLVDVLFETGTLR